MTEREQFMKIATFVCCPMCDEKECVGRFNCREINDFIKRKEEEMKSETDCGSTE